MLCQGSRAKKCYRIVSIPRERWPKRGAASGAGSHWRMMTRDQVPGRCGGWVGDGVVHEVMSDLSRERIAVTVCL